MSLVLLLCQSFSCLLNTTYATWKDVRKLHLTCWKPLWEINKSTFIALISFIILLTQKELVRRIPWPDCTLTSQVNYSPSTSQDPFLSNNYSNTRNFPWQFYSSQPHTKSPVPGIFLFIIRSSPFGTEADVPHHQGAVETLLALIINLPCLAPSLDYSPGIELFLHQCTGGSDKANCCRRRGTRV